MVRIARERIDDLFALAAREAGGESPQLADRYVALARRVGARYNVRLRPEYRELYCRGCSVYWVEGRSVRTRLRAGRRVRTCLVCGRRRRTESGRPRRDRALVNGGPLGTSARPEGALVDPEAGEAGPDDEAEDG